MTIGPGYMNTRKREEVVDGMCDTLLTILNEPLENDPHYKIMRMRQVIKEYQRFIEYHRAQDRRRERRMRVED